MSHDIQGTTLPDSVSRLVGSDLQPIIIHVAGTERAALEGILELQGNCTYIALFDENDPSRVSSYVGMTSCGQDRPRLGKHLCHASSIFVVADAGNHLTEHDAMVLERFFFAKVSECTDWTMRCGRPWAPGVGMARFSELMSFGSQVMMMLHHEFGLFANVVSRHLTTAPRQFEPILFDPFRGPPEGEKMVLDAFSVEAAGIDLGDDGFVISIGSVIRASVVPSAAGVTSARREELLHNGQLRRLDENHLVVLRTLWRPSPTSAAKFVTGSSASAAHWRPVRPRLRLV